MQTSSNDSGHLAKENKWPLISLLEVQSEKNPILQIANIHWIFTLCQEMFGKHCMPISFNPPTTLWARDAIDSFYVW